MPALERQVQAVEPVAREVDDEAGLAQALAQVVAGLGLVLDDQDLQRGCFRGVSGLGGVGWGR